MSDKPTCAVCGEPMPPGEEMFKYHGYSGNCPKPPLTKQPRPTAPEAHWPKIDFTTPDFEGITKIELNITNNGDQRWVEAVWYKGAVVVRKDQHGCLPALPLAAAQGGM
jgi:hypothetical protein